METPLPENTGRKQDGTFAPGFSGNPAGKPKGARHKLSQDFFKALAEDFAEHGQAAIEKMRDEKPNEYAKMVAGLMTKEIEGNINMGVAEALDALDDDTDPV